MAGKPGVIPLTVATGTNYATGPYIGLANKAVPLAPFTTDGVRPGGDPADATVAEFLNYTLYAETRWTREWLAEGSATALTDTHIVETDADGRTQQRGFDILEPTNRTAADWVVNNSPGTPAFTLTTGGGDGVVVNTSGGSSAAYSATPSGSSLGLSIASNSSSPPIQVSQSGSGPLLSVVGVGASSGGASIVCGGFDVDALTLTAGVSSAAPVRLAPKTAHPNNLPGRVWPHTLTDAMHFTAPSNVRKEVWATRQGMLLEAISLSFAAPATLPYIVTPAITFFEARTYLIRYTIDIGRTGSRNLQDWVSAGPFSGAFYGKLINLYQSGSENERTYTAEWVFVPPFTFTVPVSMTFLQTSGTGTVWILSGSLVIQGVFD